MLKPYFDLAQAARAYAVTMGVLAGFTFAVIVQLITKTPAELVVRNETTTRRKKIGLTEARRAAGAVLKVFVLAFLACIAAAFLYGTLSADGTASRIILANVLGAAMAANAFLLIAFALVLLAKYRDIDALPAIIFGGRTIVPFVAALFLTVSVEFFAGKPGSGHLKAQGWGVAYVVLFAVTLGLVCAVPRLATPVGRLVRVEQLDPVIQQNTITANLVVIAAGILVVCGLATAFVDELAPEYNPPLYVGLLIQVASMVIVFFYAIAIYAMSPAPRSLVVLVDNPLWVAGKKVRAVEGLLELETTKKVRWKDVALGAPRWVARGVQTARQGTKRYSVGRYRRTVIRILPGRPGGHDEVERSPSMLVTVDWGRATRVQLSESETDALYQRLEVRNTARTAESMGLRLAAADREELMRRVADVLTADELRGWELRSIVRGEGKVRPWSLNRVSRQVLVDLALAGAEIRLKERRLSAGEISRVSWRLLGSTSITFTVAGYANAVGEPTSR
jgi:hypothetical protein